MNRIDVPIPYEPDQDIVAFEEADVCSRSGVLLAASWLFQEWPRRFVECCQEAQVRYPALNRNAIRVKWYCEATKEAYRAPRVNGERKPIRSDSSRRIQAERA